MLRSKSQQDRPSHRAEPRRAAWPATLTPARAAVTAVAGATAIGGLAVAATLAAGPQEAPASDGAAITADGTTDAVVERGWAASRSDVRRSAAAVPSATPSAASGGDGAPADTTTPSPGVRVHLSLTGPVDVTPPSATVAASGSTVTGGQTGGQTGGGESSTGHGSGNGSGGHGHGGHSTPSLPGSPITVTTDPDDLLSSIPSPTLATQGSTLLGAGR